MSFLADRVLQFFHLSFSFYLSRSADVSLISCDVDF